MNYRSLYRTHNNIRRRRIRYKHRPIRKCQTTTHSFIFIVVRLRDIRRSDIFISTDNTKRSQIIAFENKDMTDGRQGRPIYTSLIIGSCNLSSVTSQIAGGVLHNKVVWIQQHKMTVDKNKLIIDNRTHNLTRYVSKSSRNFVFLDEGLSSGSTMVTLQPKGLASNECSNRNIFTRNQEQPHLVVCVYLRIISQY